MKKIISLILALTMLLSTVVSVFAATVDIEASKTALKKGETVDVTVSLSEKATAVVNFEYKVYFNSEYFELKSSAIGGACALTQISSVKTDASGSFYSLSFVDTSSKGVEIAAGKIYTLTFKAIKDITEEASSSFELSRKSFAVLSGGKISKNTDGATGTSEAKITINVKEENEPTFDDIKVTVSAPANVEKTAGTEFNAIVYSTQWDENAYKLLDTLINIPAGLEVTSVTAGERLSGGEVSYNLDSESKLRIVYNDTNQMSTIALSGTDFPAVLFTIGLKVGEGFSLDEGTVSIGGMSLKLSSNSEDEYSQHVLIISTEEDEQGNTGSTVISFSNLIAIKAAELFSGDGIDLIPEDKKAVIVSVTGLGKDNVKLSYKKGETSTELFFSEEISTMVGNLCYVAIIGKDESVEDYTTFANFTVNDKEKSEAITFGDTNGDNLINAQDALNIINAWIRKTEVKENKAYLTYNVNSDSRINTYDALAIEEAFINSSKFKIVTRAVALTSVSE